MYNYGNIILPISQGKFGYPTMIELFSRKPGYHLEIEAGIIPIHIDDDTSSLSAILLKDGLSKAESRMD